MVNDTAGWVLVVTAGAVAVVLLLIAYQAGRGLWRASERARKRRQAEQDKAKAEGTEVRREGLGLRLIVMALGGMSVSLYGMWGFARQQAGLPEPFAVGFLSMFDLTELTLFTLLYQRASSSLGWTPQLRLMHNTAWALVIVSATANWIHAPNATAAPFLAVMPVTAAWVIELELRARMRSTGPVDDESKAGPARLFGLLWSKGWAAVFAGLDLDPQSTSGQIARAALAKKASTQLFKLRSVLEFHDELLASRRAKQRDLARAVKALDVQRRRTTRAMDRSDFAVDSGQALAVLRGLAGWTRVDDVAVVDTADSTAVTRLMEEVAILPSARRIEAAERAAELEAAAERAEAARVEAEEAREHAETEKRAAMEATAAADTARREAEDAVAAANAEAEKAREETARAEAARQEAEEARARAESEMTEESRTAAELAERAVIEQKKLSAATAELGRTQDEITDAVVRREHAAAEVSALRDLLMRLENERLQAQDATRTSESEVRQVREQMERLRGELADAQSAVREHTRATERAVELRRQAEKAQSVAADDAARAEAEAREAEELLESLRPQLAERLGPGAEAAALIAGPAFRSEAKQLGWEEYVAAVTAGEEPPTATALAERYGVAVGNARNWIIEFKEKRAAIIAAGSARRARGTGSGAEVLPAQPSAEREEPRSDHADGHQRADTAEQPHPIGGQRQPV